MLLKISTLIYSLLAICVIVSTNVCHKLLAELSDKQMHLVQCVTKNAVPVYMCMNCTVQYSNMTKAYDLLNTNCTSNYFDQDRMNIVASTETMLTSLWAKAFCDDCANNNNSEVFQVKYKDYDKCINNTKNPCDECEVQYMELNSFYINLDQQNNGEVCYDLQDLMNRTRNYWSKELKCCRREYKMKLFAVAMSITLCLPLIFYSTTYFITKRQERNYHVLTDQDPTPSTSRQADINDVNIYSPLSSSNSASVIAKKNIPQSRSELKPSNKNGLNTANEDLDSSDDQLYYNSKQK